MERETIEAHNTELERIAPAELTAAEIDAVAGGTDHGETAALIIQTFEPEDRGPAFRGAFGRVQRDF